MHVNTSVVKALMYLRNISEVELSNLTHTPVSDLQDWLYERLDEDSSRVSFEVQMEILKLLGIEGDRPRSDVVHYWRTHEPLFSRPQQAYWALNIMLKAFGHAQAVFISRESDPFWTWKAQAHFGLKFEGFMAVLEVTAHPLKTMSFDPDNMADLSWVPESFGVFLSDGDYARLEPGALKVKGLNQYLTYTCEMSQWERLREAAIEQGIRAEQVAKLMLGADGPAKLTSNFAEDVYDVSEKFEPTPAPERVEPSFNPRAETPFPSNLREELRDELKSALREELKTELRKELKEEVVKDKVIHMGYSDPNGGSTEVTSSKIFTETTRPVATPVEAGSSQALAKHPEEEKPAPAAKSSQPGNKGAQAQRSRTRASSVNEFRTGEDMQLFITPVKAALKVSDRATDSRRFNG